VTYQSSYGESQKTLAVLADPTRTTLLALLRDRPLSVGELARQLPVSRPAVSQHLKILKQAHLVQEDRRGTRHYFSLDPTGFSELRDYADSMWRDALSAFAAYVSEQKKASKKRRTRKKENDHVIQT
jgi:DNA-binding transcriptional ArsR family regulator